MADENDQPASLRDLYGDYNSAVRARKRQAVTNVLFPKMALMDEQQRLKQQQAQQDSLSPMLKELVAQQKNIQGSGSEAVKQRGATLRSLITGMIRDVTNKRTNASAEKRKMLDNTLKVLNGRLTALATAERLTRPPSSSGSGSSSIMGLTQEKLIALANKTYGQISSDTDAQDPIAKAYVVAEKVPGFQRAEFKRLITAAQQRDPTVNKDATTSIADTFNSGMDGALDYMAMTGNVKGDDGQDIPIGEISDEANALYGIDMMGDEGEEVFDEYETDGYSDEMYGDQPQSLTPESSEAQIEASVASNTSNEQEARDLRAVLYGTLHPDNLDNLAATYQAKINNLNPGSTAVVETSLDSMIAALMSGHNESAQAMLRKFFGASGLSPDQQTAMNANQSYQDMLMERVADPNAGSAVRQARDIIIASPEYQAFKKEKGYMTDWAAFKHLNRQRRETGRNEAQHDLLMLRANRKGANPKTIRALEALQNKMQPPKESPIDYPTPTDFPVFPKPAAEITAKSDPASTLATPGDQRGKPKKLDNDGFKSTKQRKDIDEFGNIIFR